MTYSQRDPQWAGHWLGFGPDTIGQEGCFLSEWAQLKTWAGDVVNPDQQNEMFKVKGCFVFCGGAQVCLTDDALAKENSNWTVEEVYHCEAFPCDQNKLNNDDPNLYVVAHLTSPAKGFTTHFVSVVDWHHPTFADPWFGDVRPLDFYGAWNTVIDKVIRMRFHSGGAPAQPTPPPISNNEFTGVTFSAGVHVRTLPGTDQPIVQQPGANPDVVDGNTTITFNGWTHHTPKGGADTMPTDDWTGAPDDRWFRTAKGNWLASGGIKGNPPAGMNPMPDPAAQVPAPPPIVPPVVPPTIESPILSVPDALKTASMWETSPTFGASADYTKLKSHGFSSVFVRAANGDGTGGNDPSFVQNWQTRQPVAKLAGLNVVAWTFWYGPGDQGYTESDPSAYLRRCADYTASLNLDTPAWIVDYESRSDTGLADALVHLSAKTGKPVFLAPPGDPHEYGLNWDFRKMDASVAGIMPQMYTLDWGTAVTYEKAEGEWTSDQLLYPVLDETDPTKIADVVKKVFAKGHLGFSVWYAQTENDAGLQAYVDTWHTQLPSPPVPPIFPPNPPNTPPIPTPPPPVTPEVISWFEAFLLWLKSNQK